MMRRLTTTLVFPALALLAAGCSGGGVSVVKGKVLYNSEPLSGADLEFRPESNLELGSFGGQTDSEGRFEIKLGKGTGQNARPGRFVVLITKGKGIGMPAPDANLNEEERVKALMLLGPGGPGSAPGAAGLLPARYSASATTPFKVEISDGVNDLNPFQMEGPSLKKK
jgi:hypothetical protein